MTEPGAVPLVEPKQGWKKLILALIVFLVLPIIPQIRALLPVDDTMLLFVPAMAACSVVGWWAGGRAFTAILWVALAIYIGRADSLPGDVYANLIRGWTLLVAGAFGLACLIGRTRGFFVKALSSIGVAFALALVMSLFRPVTLSSAVGTVRDEFARRNGEFVKMLDTAIAANGAQWRDLTTKVPSLATMPTEAANQLDVMSLAGQLIFPSLLALESLAALALAWAVYHRLSRRRLGLPLAPLREFRFNDQLVWGLIAGLVILLMPNLAGVRGLGRNLVLFFGALYAVRGLGVLAWFMAPGSLALGLIAGFALLFVPFVNALSILGFLTLGITALGLGVGDTWVDWRGRAARSTLS